MAEACLFFKEANARTDHVADLVPASAGRDRGLIEWTPCSSRYTGLPTSQWVIPTIPYHPEG